MDNEKEIMGMNPEDNENEVTETVEETVEALETPEDAVEETAEVVDEATEEVVEAPAVKKTLSKVYLCDECQAICEDTVCPVCGKELTKEEAYICKAQTTVEKSKKTVKTVITVIIAAAVIVGAVFAGKYVYKEIYNPYNHGEYAELGFGETLEDVIGQLDMDVEEFLETYQLPADMGLSTYSNIANQYIPMKLDADNYGMSVQDFVNEVVGIEGEFGDDATLGEVQGEIPLKDYFQVENEEEFAEYREKYGFGDDVTLETKFKDVRAQIYKVSYEQQQKAEAQAETEDETAEAESTEETESADAQATQTAE